MTCCSLVTWICPLFREDAMFLFLCSLCPHRNYMNDSLRTNVFVRFQAETIACACIYLAARALQVRGNSVSAKSVFFFFVHCHWPSVQLMLVLRRLMPSFPRYLCPPSLIGTCCLVSLKMRLKRSASPPWSFTPGRRYFFWKVENLPAPVRFKSLTPTVHSTLLWTVMTVV